MVLNLALSRKDILYVISHEKFSLTKLINYFNYYFGTQFNENHLFKLGETDKYRYLTKQIIRKWPKFYYLINKLTLTSSCPISLMPF